MSFLHRLVSRTRSSWLAQNRVLGRLGFVRPPTAVQWIATSQCNLRCPHCYSEAGERDVGELTTDEACRLLVDELVALDRPTLVFAGGEPLLRSDFEAVVRHTHERGVPWAMHSHGGLVREWQEVFRRYPPIMVAISLDGPRTYHDRFRGRGGSFDGALEAMALLKEAGCPEVVAGTTITRGNADQLHDMVPTILASAADSWGFHLMTPEGRGSRHRSMLATPAQLKRVAALARRLRGLLHVELDNEWGSAGDEDCFYRDDEFLCGAGRFSCVVSATGEVMPCTTTDPSESAGNIRDRPLREIWAEGFQRFRAPEDALRSDCNDCWLQTRSSNSCRKLAFQQLLTPEVLR